MNLADIFQVDRAGLAEHLKGAVAVTENGLRTGNPRVVMTEDPCVFLITRRIRGNFAELDMIFCVSRLQQDDAIFCLELLLNTFQRGFGLSVLYADACHYAHALRLDIDLALFTGMAPDRLAICVIGTDKPVAVPSGIFDGGLHFLHIPADFRSFFIKTDLITQLRILCSVFDIHSSDKNRLCHRSLARTEGLKAFAGFL